MTSYCFLQGTLCTCILKIEKIIGKEQRGRRRDGARIKLGGITLTGLRGEGRGSRSEEGGGS